MGHLGLWLERYGKRRAQILDSWSAYAKTVEEVRLKLPREKIFREVGEECPPEARMCFVDGGEGLQELLGLGVYFIRASGLVLSPAGGETSSELFLRDLDMNVIDYDDHTKERVELLRDGMEYDIAIRSIEECRPGILFLDGSLYVKARRKPIECLEYELYRKKFARLLRLCRREGVRLVGVSEDSKSRLMAHHLASEHRVKFPKFMTDSTILRILSGGGPYRSVEFTPPSRIEAGMGMGDGMAAGFPTAYLQPSDLANPLRVDVPDWERDFDGILSLIARLCRGSGYFGYPLPLYLAHMDAHIPPSQMDWTVKQVVSYMSRHDIILGDAVMKATRRSSRPG